MKLSKSKFILQNRKNRQPQSVIKEFFEDVKLIEVRIHLYNLLEVALTQADTVYDEALERNAVLYFVRRLEKTIETAWIIVTPE